MKIQTFEEYKKLADRTLSDGFYINVNKSLIHGVMGIVTEVQEIYIALKSNTYDKANIAEEIGDCLWYVAACAKKDNLNLTIDSLYDLKAEDSYYYGEIDAMDSILDRLVYTSGEMLDLIKKSLFYNRVIMKDRAEELLYNLCENLTDLAHICGFSLQKCAEINIKKLQTRFKDKFTNELANNRDLQKERQVLENGVAPI